MGRHNHALRDPDEVDWEEAPPPAPLWRTRVVRSAVLLLAVVAATWWAVGWLTSPAGPGGPGAPVAASVEDAPPSSADPARPGPAVDGAGPGPTAPPGPGAGDGASSSVADAGPTGGEESVTVHVAGEVREPGLVALPAGARVDDALQAAGGPTGEAALDLLNLAAPAEDGSQILVPGPDGLAGGATGTAGAGAALSGEGADTGVGPEAAGAVNLNTADITALEQLPGIGPALAGRIAEHREQVGPFGSLEDLDAVSGIGPAMMESLDGLVTW
ncbi:ComEA family DNA-binding protein [Citricoccus sp.]|uniref:ComEA family DNA-binding protein n=1 Tax=Citricoccus sp. TaxID=1978372 RepID=UPI0028BDDF3B|nr:ComEA family DNA-binding protein [Citricoccus sp.]